MSAPVYRKNLFDIPDGLIYLDGNSLGPLPKAARARAQAVIDNEWGRQLIRGWNDAGWYEQPLRVGNQLAPLIGAPRDSVVVGDTLSLRLYPALAAALSLRPERREILSDDGNFPSDRYMMQGLADFSRSATLRSVARSELVDALDDDVAVLCLTHVDYRTGSLHDIATLTRAAHEKGVLVVWDLAHSTGAIPLDLAGCEVDLS